jgi:hypothetical protein
MGEALLNIRHESEPGAYCCNATCQYCEFFRKWGEQLAVAENFQHLQICAAHIDGIGCPGVLGAHYWPPISMGGLA